MFWTEESIAKNIAELEEIDAAISDLRKQAAVVVNRLNKAGVAGRYGARSIVDWLSAKLDMSRARAGELVFASRFGAHRDIERRLVDGEISFDRAMSTLRLAEAGASDDTVRQSYQMDVGRVAHDTYLVPAEGFWWMIATEDAIWGHDAGGVGDMHRFDLAARQFTDAASIGMEHVEIPSAVVAGGGLWISGTDGNTVRLDLETLSVSDVVEADGSTPLFTHGAVWISNRWQGTVLRIDPESRQVTDTIQVGARPYGPIAAVGATWVPNRGDFTLSRIDPTTREVTGTIVVGGVRIHQLIATEGALWVLGGDRVTRIEIR